jgi:hypothetical protein
LIYLEGGVLCSRFVRAGILSTQQMIDMIGPRLKRRALLAGKVVALINADNSSK